MIVFYIIDILFISNATAMVETIQYITKLNNNTSKTNLINVTIL